MIEAVIEIYLEIAQASSSFGGPHRVLRGVVSFRVFRVFEALLGVEEMDLALRVDVHLRICTDAASMHRVIYYLHL